MTPTPDEIFDGLDDVDWPYIGFSHADSPAATLRDIASEDPEVAQAAVDRFWAAMNTRAPVYPATVECIPYLVRLCAAGKQTRGLLELLQSIAVGANQPRSDQEKLVKALAGQLPRLLPHLTDTDKVVRARTVAIVRHCGPSPQAARALRDRWADEPDAGLKAALLDACRRADPTTAAGLAATATGPEQPSSVRLAAATCLVATGAAWTAGLAAAASAWAHGNADVPPAGSTSDSHPDAWRHTAPDDTFVELLTLLAGRGMMAEAVELLTTAVDAGGPASEQRQRRLVAGIDTLCGEYRGAPTMLAPLLATLLGVEDKRVVGQALGVVDRIGPEGKAAADALVALAESDDDAQADQALAVLVRLGDPRGVPLLARDLPRRGQALEAAAGRGSDKPIPYASELLDAARKLLGGEDKRGTGTNRLLCTLLGSWGRDAVPALPELFTLLEYDQQYAPAAVAAVAAGTAEKGEAVTRLTEADQHSTTTYHRLIVAEALHTLTGDNGRLREAADRSLTGTLYEARDAVRIAGQLGTDAAPLLPKLRTLLTAGQTWTGEDRVATAAAMYAIAGESVVDELHPVLWKSLDARVPAAATLVGQIGAPVADLAKRLVPLLRSVTTALPAARALLALPDGKGVGPDGVTTSDELTKVLLLTVEHGRDHRTAIELLRQVGGGKLGAEAVDGLRTLLDSDRRPRTSGYEPDRIRTDQRRVAALRDALGETAA